MFLQIFPETCSTVMSHEQETNIALLLWLKLWSGKYETFIILNDRNKLKFRSYHIVMTGSNFHGH